MNFVVDDGPTNHRQVSSLRKETEVEKREKEQNNQAGTAEKKGKAATPWTEEELGLLAQGIAKFPGGTPNRWRLIADLVNQKVFPAYLLL